MRQDAGAAIRELRSQLQQTGRLLRLEKIRAEASVRQFYRLFYAGGRTCVAMVYPQPNSEEIARIVRFARLYRDCGVCVPLILDQIGERILLQEDAGDLMLQKHFRGLDRAGKNKMIGCWTDMLLRIRDIDCRETQARLDPARMKWELDFFWQNIGDLYPGLRSRSREVVPLLHRLVEQIDSESVFAHRDFHSRNMLWRDGRVYLVDFQDSLVAPPLYDFVSLAFDAYIDLQAGRDLLAREAEKRGLVIDRRQLLLTALQRNIKALGTFAFQVGQRRNLKYRRYMPRTLAYVRRNLDLLTDPYFKPLSSLFSCLGKIGKN